MANINLSGSIGTTGIAILGSAVITNPDAPYVLSVNEYTNNYLNITGSLTAQRAVIAPLTVGVSYIVRNSTTGGFPIEFKGPTGTGVLVLSNSIVAVVSDGTNYNTISGAGLTVEDEGSVVNSSVSKIDFIGQGVDATYDGINSKVLVTIPGFIPPVEIEFIGYGIIQDGLAEVGQYITNARFKAEYSITPALVELTDDDGTPLKDVTSTPNSFFSDGYHQKLNFGEEVNFTLTADGYTDLFTVVWGQRNYFGIGPAGSSSAAFILGLSSIINNSVEAVFSVHPGPSDKIYYAYRTAYGTPSIFVNGFEGGFTLVSTTIPITNSFGFTENYTLYESDNAGLGLTSVEVF